MSFLIYNVNIAYCLVNDIIYTISYYLLVGTSECEVYNNMMCVEDIDSIIILC